MEVNIDQSGKIEQLRFDTIVALSNEIQYCIKIPKQIKREILSEYRNKVKQLRYKLFAISIFYCIQDYIKSHKASHIIICCEYKGKENLMKSFLFDLLKRKKLFLNRELVSFQRIGKNSNAHIVAIDAFRKNRKPNKILTKKEIVELLK